MPAPDSEAPLAELVLDETPFDIPCDSYPDRYSRPRSHPGSHLHERYDGPPKGRRGDPRANSGEYTSHELLDVSQRRWRVPSRRPHVSHCGFSSDVRDAGFWRLPSDDTQVQPKGLLRNSRTRTCQRNRPRADHDQYADAISRAQELRLIQPGGTWVWRISHGPGTRPPHQRGSAERAVAPGLRIERNRLSHRSAGSGAHGDPAHFLWQDLSGCRPTGGG